MNKNLKEKAMQLVFLLAACASILAVILICVFMFGYGFPAMSKIGIFKFLSGTAWKPLQNIYGILPMIIGSVYVTAGAIIIGVPIGLLCAIYMASLCELAISNAVKGLLDDNDELLKLATETDSEIDEKEREIETLCLRLLLQQQPVARDLRTISSALKMISDMERIGDQASDIAVMYDDDEVDKLFEDVSITGEHLSEELRHK